MNDRLEHILLQDNWSAEELRALKAACSADRELGKQMIAWADLSRKVGFQFRHDLPESRLLVLYALCQSNLSDCLTDDEEIAVRALREQIDRSPSSDTIQLILGRIQQDAASFDAEWNTAASIQTSQVADRVNVRQDRRAVRRVFLPRPVLRWGPAIAAVLAVTVIAVSLFRQSAPALDTLVYRAEAGQTKVVSFPDGSTARLVDGSEISHRIDPEGFDRQISLHGRAYFEVVPGPDQFNVTTYNAIVSVYGTSFGVSTDETGVLTEVVLVSGSVRLQSLQDASTAVALAPGQASRVLGNDAPLEPTAVNVDRALSWTDLFIFRETQLLEATERLSESFDVPISVSETIEKRTVTGTFSRGQGLKPILDAIATALNVSVFEIPETGGFSLSP